MDCQELNQLEKKEMTLEEKKRAYLMARTDRLKNVKEMIGQELTVNEIMFKNYVDDKGEHVVAVIDTDKGMFRSEVGAFVEACNIIVQVFGSTPDVLCRIDGKSSKRGNAYCDIEVVM